LQFLYHGSSIGIQDEVKLMEKYAGLTSGARAI
jgi:hypothetical protein